MTGQDLKVEAPIAMGESFWAVRLLRRKGRGAAGFATRRGAFSCLPSLEKPFPYITLNNISDNK